jgi:hypothetical protein
MFLKDLGSHTSALWNNELAEHNSTHCFAGLYLVAANMHGPAEYTLTRIKLWPYIEVHVTTDIRLPL